MGRIIRQISGDIDGVTERVSGDPVEVVIEADLGPIGDDVVMRITWPHSTGSFAVTLREDSVNDMLEILECVVGMMCQKPAVEEDKDE